MRNIPLQETDILLHESGAPPIHTPLKVLQELPQKVKDRLYVVHTSALSADSGLRVAPTGTAGTIRLDENYSTDAIMRKVEVKEMGKTINEKDKLSSDLVGEINLEYETNSPLCCWPKSKKKNVSKDSQSPNSKTSEQSNDNIKNPDQKDQMSTQTSQKYLESSSRREIGNNCETCGFAFDTKNSVPLVALRPTCVSDAWFMLNLLSAIPFFSR